MTDSSTPEDPAHRDPDTVARLSNARRSFMKLLGAGAALSMGSGVAAANHGGTHDSARLDPYFGYSSPGGQPSDVRMDEKHDHTVELHIGHQPPIVFHFAPLGLHVEPGDVVRFEIQSPDHTITAYHAGHGRQQRVPDDAKPFSSPIITPGGYWLYRFDEPGIYDINCAPHEFFGMVMRIVVGDPDADGYDGTFSEDGRPPVSEDDLRSLGIDTSQWPFATPAEIFATAALSEANIVAVGSVSRQDVVDDL